MSQEPTLSHSSSAVTMTNPPDGPEAKVPTALKSEIDIEAQASRDELVSDGVDGATIPVSPSEPSEKRTGSDADIILVDWDDEHDRMNPLNMRSWRKWAIVAVIALSCIVVTCTSSVAGNTYPGMEKEFHIGTEVATLSISLYVLGLGSGPLILGPLSEFIGRAKVLHYSFTVFWLLGFPVAFGNNVAVHMIFRYLTGFAGSAFLSVAGGSITDVFHNHKVATPMMFFSTAPFIGPVLGPLIAGFINQHTNWHWTYYTLIIWGAVMLVLLFVFVPETYAPKLLEKKARHRRRDTGDDRHKALSETHSKSFLAAVKKSLSTPFVLLSTQPMVLFLDLWSAIILGILYLFFGGLPYVFRTQYNFNTQETGLAFLGIGVGQVIASATQPYFNMQYRKAAKANGGVAPPESRLLIAMYGGVLGPIGVLLFGLTSFKSVHWIVPIIMSSFFGMSIVYSYSGTFTYLVDAYRSVAASALSSNGFVRSVFAAAFPLFGLQMYKALGPVGGTCLLGGLLILCAPLPFIFYKIGAGIRAKSQFSQQR